MSDEAQEYLRYLFVKPTRRQRLRRFIRHHMPHRRKPFRYQPGMRIGTQDGSKQTISSVQETKITVTREKRP
jgi:hypothetical protein